LSDAPTRPRSQASPSAALLRRRAVREPRWAAETIYRRGVAVRSPAPNARGAQVYRPVLGRRYKIPPRATYAIGEMPFETATSCPTSVPTSNVGLCLLLLLHLWACGRRPFLRRPQIHRIRRRWWLMSAPWARPQRRRRRALRLQYTKVRNGVRAAYIDRTTYR
jgi:hypothetical protein